ncbi:MAG TPA: leucine--tRNA ligase [Chitinophagales bacterium]|nr:leucine--tRNA ligase [Chitinophagales bacterium]
MEYKFSDIEKDVKEFWTKHDVYRVELDHSKPKYYALDFFPYPSGAGLHVGHPLGYIACDIYARFKRLKGFNVLHPMGFDSFGLPAEQYAIQTGQHPAVTTEKNIQTFKEQLDKIGFSFDWSREIRTSDPGFYKWTQWIFIKLFHSWYNKKTDKAEPIASLILEFGENGNSNVDAVCDETRIFSADEWKNFSEKEKSDTLLNYRIAYLANSWVNWCAALGTVLANDEVKDGVSERGGYPVERKLMKQWSLRITAYAERLLNGLEKIEWSEAIKESQRNWIGKSEGCSIQFTIHHSPFTIEVFTTRPDTVFGATFITLAPEHELVEKITTPEYKKQVEEYVAYAKNRSERERMTDIKKITGQFTGTYAIHPFSGKQIPVWIGEYVLATYGTGAVMGVPGHDERDHRFAIHFGLPVISIIEGVDVTEKSFDEKDGIVCNSDFLNGLSVPDAIKKAVDEIEKQGIGKRKVNYKLRDAIFGRQRYWGEPIPIYYNEEGIPNTVDESDLPVVLPEVDKYLPTETGESPLARATNWKYKGKYEYELTTMPGWAGSNWYYLRYGDPNNEKELASKEAINYWQNIDLYLGGDEHATGHLMYFRFCTKFLFDIGVIPFDEPAKKLVNQGKITHVTQHISRLNGQDVFISRDIFNDYLSENNLDLVEDTNQMYIDINLSNQNKMDVEAFKRWRPEYANATFIKNSEGEFLSWDGWGEKMSKSKYNVVNPDEVVEKYGADAFRLYEMFLGPLEQSKPWDTKGIDGVFRFLKKFWKLFFDEEGNFVANDEAPTKNELKILHRTIKKAGDDIEVMSFNTSVSAFMICVNELTALNCHKKKILEPLLIIVSPFAPFISEFLWQKLGNATSITQAYFPIYDESLLVETSFEYPVAINGKTRVKMNFDLNLPQEQIEKEVLSAEQLQKYFDGKTPKKVIVVKGKMINVVV